MKNIPLTKGKFAIVDDDDFEWLSKWKWFVNGRYASRSINKHQQITMHREIMHTPDDMETDHINRNGLDNRKENLRICTRSENQQNKMKSNSTGFKGVQVDKRRGYAYYYAHIGRKHIGAFPTAIEAAKAYDAAARELYGSFACVNFPNETHISPICN